MSVLEIYINWVNSVLGETGSHVDGVEVVQDGKVLCELIDILAPDAGLVNKVKSSGETTPMAFISAALDHMKGHGIKIKFPAQDILHNEIKSMLDALWLLILNYGIHYIGQNVAQRSVGNGKKRLLEWCQEELGAVFDSRNTLSFNLCNGSWFVRLLEKMAGCSMKKSEDREEYIDSLLTEIQDRYLIKKNIIKSHDIVDGTADEHTLMIYLSLLKRRMTYSDRPSRREMLSTDGKAAAMAKIHFFERRARSLSNDSVSPRSSSPINRGRSLSSGRSSSLHSEVTINRPRSSRGILEQTIADGNETSDWSSTGSLILNKEKTPMLKSTPPIKRDESNEILQRTISERVTEQFPVNSESDREDKEAESQRVSEKETDTLSDFSSSSLARDRSPVKIVVQSNEGLTVPIHNLQEETPLYKPKYSRSSESPTSILSKNTRKSETENQDPRISTVRKKNEPDRSASSRSPSPISNIIIDSKHLNGNESRGKKISERPNSPLNRRNRNIEHSSLNSCALHDDIPSEKQTEKEIRSGSSTDEDVRIKIRRPKDYILQWEDTMGRLSGVPYPNEASPRPLISNYRVEVPSRSKSSDFKSPSPQTPDWNSIRSRSIDLNGRSGDRFQPSFSPDSSPDRRPPSNLRSQSVYDPGLEAVLSQLPESLRQKALDASKFLMQTNRPEVIDLIDVIKKAREGVQITMPSGESRIPHSTSSSVGSRVRFQTSSRSPQARDIERGESSMLLLSPRNRSRSLSPRSASNPRQLSDNSMNSRSQENVYDSQEAISHREEMLRQTLGMNSTAVEDERPSSRITSIASPPRRTSPGSVHKHSSRKQAASTENKYPEVTRLYLSQDSDRSFTSQVDENGVDDVTPRHGGLGRVPRREAWELQKRRREQNTFNPEDPAAQSKFIDVLCKEIDALRVKVEMMEDDGIGHGQRSRSRSYQSQRSRSERVQELPYSRKDLLEEDNKLFLNTQSNTCKFTRNSSCPLLEISSRSNMLSKSPSAQDNTVLKQSTLSPRDNRRSYSSTSTNRSPVLTTSQSPRQNRGSTISLGYSGPTRSITPEIWGNDLNTPEGLDPKRQEKWKRLISGRDISENCIIELKQALASAIVEHDILSAKLSNAKHEIHDKLRHTNEVLDDCRHHLAKSQAENMELRTKVEQERQRGDNYELKIKAMENTVHEVHNDNKQLEKELNQTATLLDKSLVETKPGIEVLREEKTRLVTRLANAETDNERMRNEVDCLKRNQVKTMETMDELRECLCKVRKERQEIYEQYDSLQRKEQTAKVKEIMNSYQKRGLLPDDDEQHTFSRSHSVKRNNLEHLDSDEGMFSGSQTSADAPLSINIKCNKNSRLLDTSFSSSPGHTPRRSASQNRYLNEELSPIDREIYPHRKSYQSRSRSCSPFSARAANYNYLNNSNLDNSIIDQTLQEIEKDMQRERDNILFRVNDKHRLRYIPYLEDDPNHSLNSSGTNLNLSNQGLNNDKNRRCSAENPRYFPTRSAKPSPCFHGNSSTKRSTSVGSVGNSPRPCIPRAGTGSRHASRSRSPSVGRTIMRNDNRIGYKTPERSASPVYFPRSSHSPPTRLSPENKDKNMEKRRPRHEKTKPGEIARNLQKEFEKEDKMLSSFSKSSVFKNKSWIEVQSDSDEDTGINSSISSFSGSERSGIARAYSKELIGQIDNDTIIMTFLDHTF